MPNAKRASMREGPLAALFRKTAEDASPAPEEPSTKGKRKAKEPPATKAEAPVAKAQTPAAKAQTPAAKPQTSAAKSDGPAAKPRRQAPHPAVAEPQPALELDEPHIPSPQERLRHAFSADIPHSLMDRPGRPETGVPAPATPAAEDVYARSERLGDAFAPPRPVGTPVIRVVGVGGAGVNAVNRMIEAEVEGVDFVAINTDLQSLQQCAAAETLHIGDSVTRGLGSGSNPDLGRQAAREEYDRIKALVRGSDMVFIAAGAGGGTGTGAAPVVAQIAREVGALTVGIVTRPFQFEGSRRSAQAEAGIAALADEVDTLIVVPNNRLLTVLDRNTSMVEAFRVADDVLRQGVQGVSDLVTLPGLINLDFADVRTIMSNAGNALLGIGMGTGERRAIDAAEAAVASPLLETSMDGARSILLSITGGPDLSLWEVNEAARAVAEAAHPDANIIFGAMLDEKLIDGQVWVTVVATGYVRPRQSARDLDGLGQPARSATERSWTSVRDWSERDHAGERDRDERDRGGRDRDGRDRGEPDRGARDRRELREPDGEPRVSRRERSFTGELDVPEFIPRR